MSELIPQHSRVQLKNGADSVYLYAVTGSEGWIRDTKTDDEGFDLVLVEWDKDHWRYNGQADGWTFANHFHVIGDPELPAKEKIESELSPTPISDFLAELVDTDEDEEPGEAKALADMFIDALSDAFEAASESEGFMMITVGRKRNPANPKETLFVPEIHSFSLSEEARLIIDVQLTEYTADSYQAMVQQMLELIVRSKKGLEDGNQ